MSPHDQKRSDLTVSTNFLSRLSMRASRNSVDVQLLAPYQESLALLGPWIGGFLEDRDNGNVAPCTLQIEWMLC